jgi:sarcosine oxidase subunit gamma
VPDLISEPPLGGAETRIGAASLTALPHVPLHLVAPFPGAAEAMGAALTAAHGTGWPGPGQCTASGEVELRWAGRDQALLIGPAAAPDLGAHGAVTDVSDVYVRLLLTGRDEAADILARLVPLDLRPARFAPGATAKSLLGHISAQVTATQEGVEIMVMRSFARTAFHEIETAMAGVAARAALPPG